MFSLKSQFFLRSDITYLNFGSFGACPKPVFEFYLERSLELEKEPVQFMAVTGPAYVKESKQALAGYVGCDPIDLVFTPNPTHAVNIIANSLDLKEGDEILSTDIEYGALDRTWKYFCDKKKAVYVRQPTNFPISSQEEFVEQFWKGYSPKTRAIFISHITSATGIILPVKEICRIAKEKGLITIVDGAHVPGHIPFKLSDIQADMYTGACHKWMMTPKGCSFLHVKKEFQEMLEPLIVSWGYESDAPSGSNFQDHHQFNGTRDFSAYTTIPAAIKFMQENEWDKVAASCRKMVIDNAPRFCELLATSPLTPLSPEFLGQMFSIPVNVSRPAELQKLLFDKYQIEIPVMNYNGKSFIRYSINGFNEQSDLDHLYDSLREIKTDLVI